MSPSLPPPQPAYVLRGHASQIHSLAFSPSNASILSADASGYVVVWSLSTKRALASWQPHSSAVLSVALWSEILVVTHGRDSKVHIWGLWKDDGEPLESVLPADRIENPGLPAAQQPVLLHSLTVNTLNFCGFAWCWESLPTYERREDLTEDRIPLQSEEPTLRFDIGEDQESDRVRILLALPHTLDSEAVDIHSVSCPLRLLLNSTASTSIKATANLPSTLDPTLPITSSRSATLQPPSFSDPKTGLTMCLSLPNPSTLIAGYESGHTIVYTLSQSFNQHTDALNPATAQNDNSASFAAAHADKQYTAVYVSRPHSQPILSLAPSPNGKYYVTTSADAIVARHRLPKPVTQASTQDTYPAVSEEPSESMLNTKHAGQQGMAFRDDGLIFATAGWDGRGRVYRGGDVPSSEAGKESSEGTQGREERPEGSAAKQQAKSKATARAKPMKELAVLKWHKDGCYCTAFGHVAQRQSAHSSPSAQGRNVEQLGAKGNGELSGYQYQTVAQRREEKALSTHWLALGSKDGKVSLWDVF